MGGLGTGGVCPSRKINVTLKVLCNLLMCVFISVVYLVVYLCFT